MAIIDLNEQQIFYFELGRFVSGFALAESMVFLFLSSMLGIDKDECNAITSGAKIDACVGFIKRLYEARGIVVPEKIKECFEHLAIVNKLRNDLLHKGASSEFIITNEVRSLPNRLEIYTVSSKMLSEANDDVAKITFTLSTHQAPISGPLNELEKIQSLLDGPWKYKQPSPIHNHHTNPKKPLVR